MENVLFPWASLQPTATVAYWAEAQLASPRRRPLDGPCRWCTSALGVACSELERRYGFHLSHPHGSSYESQYLNLGKVAGNRGLTGEAVRAVATDDVDGGNDSKVREGTHRSSP
jgi:hypothetical protein